jgi:hypothetical protein
MRRILILGALGLGLVLLMSCKDKQPETKCVYGNDIATEDRDPIQDSTDRMADLLVGGSYKDLYELGSTDLKSHQSRDQFGLALDVFVRAFGAIDYPNISELYLMSSKAGKEKQVNIACNLGEPGINDIYAMPANRELVSAVYEATSKMEMVRIVFQLERENGNWKLRSLALYPRTIKHQTADYFLKEGLRFREENRLHLAVLYLKTSAMLHDLGFNVTEFTVLVIEKQIKQIKVDFMPAGEVQNWETDSGSAYKVYTLDTAYDNGSLMVQINYLTDTLTDTIKLRDEALDLAVFLDRKFPEYRQGFDGVRVTAAPERPEERFQAYHTSLSFVELDAYEKANPLGVKKTVKPEEKKEANKEGKPETPAPKKTQDGSTADNSGK